MKSNTDKKLSSQFTLTGFPAELENENEDNENYDGEVFVKEYPITVEHLKQILIQLEPEIEKLEMQYATLDLTGADNTLGFDVADMWMLSSTELKELFNCLTVLIDKHI